MADLSSSGIDNKYKEIYDALTGAYTRAMLDERLIQEFDWAKRCDLPLSLCFIDLDYFKSINDAYGHGRGDEVLVSLVKRIGMVMRKSDMLFRYGGDEFVLIFPNTQKEEALPLLIKIHEVFKSEPVVGNPPLTLSLSMGVASFPGDAQSVEALLKSADSRCYEAKRNGRGCIISDCELDNTCINFSNGDLLVERERVDISLEYFIESLPSARRGVLGLLGPSGSGCTVLLDRVFSLAEKDNLYTIKLSSNDELKSLPYGVIKKSKEFNSANGYISIDYIENTLINLVNANNKKGIVFIIDNLKYTDYATINFIRYLMIYGKFQSIGLVYSNEKDDLRSFENLKVPLYEIYEIKPLTLVGTYKLLKNILKCDVPDEFVTWLNNQTKGLPKHIFEGLSYLYEQDVIKIRSNNKFIIDEEYKNVYLDKRLGIKSNMPYNNIPKLTTEFVGRENEIRELNKLLDKNRLVTILGTGGIGKTRLAIQVAIERLNDYKDGVYFIPLASVNQPDLVISAITTELNIKEMSGQLMFDTVKEYFSDKHCLVILDNFEQVISSASIISELLAAAPLLSVLVTSREAMRISGEYIYNIPFMDIKKNDKTYSVEEIIVDPAIALFITRAQTVKPDFILTEVNAPLVIELCGSLDGIPLAIELAASNINELSIEEMLIKNKERLKWAWKEMTVVPERQQTLNNVIEWSYNMLGEAEKKFFNRLGIFAGSFTKKAAENVVSEGLDSLDINDGFRMLINKCLIRISFSNTRNEEIYLDMIETIREYALNNLKNCCEYEIYVKRHAEYYLMLIEEANEKLNGHMMKEWLNRIERAYLNIRRAIEWSQEAGNTDMELRLAAAMGLFWETRGFWSEGKNLLEGIIDKYQGKYKSEVFAKVYHWYGKMLMLQGENKKAMIIFEEGLALCRELGNVQVEASILHNLAYIYGLIGNVEEQEKMLLDSLELYKQINDKSGMAVILSDLGMMDFYVGKYDMLSEYSNESLQLSKETENKRCMSWALLRLGYAERSKGKYEEAIRLFKNALDIHEELDDKMGITESLISLAEIMRSQGEYDLALQYYYKNLNICEDIGYKELKARIMNDLGEVYRYRGDYNLARDFYENSLKVLKEINHKGNIIWVYRNLAELKMIDGDFAEAKAYFIKSLELHIITKQRSLVHLMLVLGGLAEVETESGNLIKAAILIGAAQLLADKVKRIISKNDMAEYDRRFLYIESKMSEEDFRKAYDEGYSMDLENVLRYSMEV
ncbi:diguanylate cyclase [Pseudobacteroides cellulosolvens]|uniref:Diguanylate cyclase n=1 Tax=Pseudobacteroides cellulosolvens ATCC 35603 = DSM 2933 TaxID=398512 RepID=A0A0L6JSR0_9FIRM|nr:diguanylate cyclase [Pseudobacteroides cellulosolvens]KNY28462.1 diguanylate cyclase [Pseudobacteroides cellulosolvens ATCC 35603 = DSM 2933]